MKSLQHGLNTSAPEVTLISTTGFWLLINEREYFLAFDDFPWFKEAKISELIEVELLHSTHLCWKSLDIDLEIDTIENPSHYPLFYK